MTSKIIDFHAHAFPKKVASKAVSFLGDYYQIPMKNNGALNDLWASASEANVEAVVVHASATKPEQVESINTWIAKQIDGEKLIGFGTIHPDYDGNIKKEIERIKELGLKGIKLHPDFQRFNIDDPNMDKVYELLDDTLPVLFHLGDENVDYSSPRRLSNVLERYPNMVVIGAHMGGYMRWDEAEEYLFGRNIYIDTSSCLHRMDNNTMMRYIRKHGAHRVVFGTDYPIITHKEELEKIKALPLTNEEKAMILYKNAEKILKRGR